MSVKLLSISTMYPGYLRSFYDQLTGSGKLSYDEHYKLLLDDTTEFVGSYTKTFNKLGVDAKCVIANDNLLQNKWLSENLSESGKDKNVILEQVKKFQPDVLWIDNLNFTDVDFLKTIREKVKSIKLIIAYHCSPFNQKNIRRLELVDFIITCTPGLKKEMENKGFRSYLVYHGFDTDLLKRVDGNNSLSQNNFVFSGSLSTGADYHGERIKLVESILKADIDISLFVNLEKKYKIRAKQILYLINEFLKKINAKKIKNHIPFLRYGESEVKSYSKALMKKKHDPVFGTDMYKLFYNSRVVLNIHIGVAGNYAGNMRLFEVTGVGSCLLTDNKINLKDLFDVDKEIVVYNNVEDCIAKAKWLFENDAERKRIAMAGQRRTLGTHTVEKRCMQILEIINKELNNFKIKA
jgi:spore maturation protein CgeB